MTRPIFLTALVLAAVCLLVCAASASLGQADAQSRREQTRAVLGAVDACDLPCWQGIRPGHTSSSEAMNRLRQLPGVTHITFTQGIAMSESVVDWSWNGQQSPIIDGSRGARMWLNGGVVAMIDLPLTVSFASVWDALGPPDKVRAVKSPRVPPAVFYHASWFGGGLELHATITCPLRAWNTLEAVVEAQMQDPVAVSARHPLLAEAQGCP